MKTTKELADDAEDRLIKRGYKQGKCVSCKGSGLLYKTPNGLQDILCPTCQGRGWTWQAPMTR